jgi:O-antigen/teichoic acid export membrane protein
LDPKDYGVIAMLAIFMAISQTFIDSGFTNALIRKEDRSDIDFSTVFYFNIFISLVLYAILFVSSPLIARYFRTESLKSITRVFSLSLPISALGAIQRTKFTIKIDFKSQAIAALIGAIIGGITGILLALRNLGAWALVYSALANVAATTILMWIISPWRPRAGFSLSSLRAMFSFGSKLLLSGLLDTIYKNLYQVVIGRKFNSQELGYYSRADQFAQFPSVNITGILQRVTYPVLCEMATNEERLFSAYRRFLKMSAFIIFPLMIGLSAVSKPLVYILLGEKWNFSSTILQIICFSYMWYPIHAINLNALIVKGRSDLFFRLEIAKKVVGVIILVIVMQFSIEVMAIGTIVSSLVALFINTYYSKGLFGYGFGRQLADLIPIFLISILSCVPAFIVSTIYSHSILLLAISIISAIIIYFFLAKMFLNEEYHFIYTTIENRLKLHSRNKY